MLYRLLADFVVLFHFAFLGFITVGPVLAWWWPKLVWAHLPALAWAVGSITVGLPCPLTPLEKRFRRLAGEEGYEGGFIDHYIEDVIYPDELTPWLRALVGVAVVAGYAALAVRRSRRRTEEEPAERHRAAA